jgi:hypothetical protein
MWEDAEVELADGRAVRARLPASLVLECARDSGASGGRVAGAVAIAPALRRVLTVDAWRQLDEAERGELAALLPAAARRRPEPVLGALFSGAPFFFGNPVAQAQQLLVEGQLAPPVAALRADLRRLARDLAAVERNAALGASVVALERELDGARRGWAAVLPDRPPPPDPAAAPPPAAGPPPDPLAAAAAVGPVAAPLLEEPAPWDMSECAGLAVGLGEDLGPWVTRNAPLAAHACAARSRFALLAAHRRRRRDVALLRRVRDRARRHGRAAALAHSPAALPSPLAPPPAVGGSLPTTPAAALAADLGAAGLDAGAREDSPDPSTHSGGGRTRSRFDTLRVPADPVYLLLANMQKSMESRGLRATAADLVGDMQSLPWLGPYLLPNLSLKASVEYALTFLQQYGSPLVAQDGDAFLWASRDPLYLTAVEAVMFFQYTRALLGVSLTLQPSTLLPSCSLPLPSPEESARHRSEETRRYANSAESFRYSTPLLGSYTPPIRVRSTRSHPFLKEPRPADVTVVALVRDACSRLPGGVGTRGDVLRLLRDSQWWISSGTKSLARELQVLSTSLDRLQAERDAPILFIQQSKLWVYLWRHRS